jgi:hypothetical protein
MAAGTGLTTTNAELKQPDGIMYEITALPALTPVTTPAPLTVAIAVLPDTQLPPDVALENGVVAITQIADGPVIPAGVRLTETTALL